MTALSANPTAAALRDMADQCEALFRVSSRLWDDDPEKPPATARAESAYQALLRLRPTAPASLAAVLRWRADQMLNVGQAEDDGDFLEHVARQLEGRS